MQPNPENTSCPSPAGQTPALRCGDLFGWLVENHVRVRLSALVIILVGLFIGGESDSQAVKWTCFAFVVPLLAMAQLDCDVWRFIFRLKPNDRDQPRDL